MTSDCTPTTNEMHEAWRERDVVDLDLSVLRGIAEAATPGPWNAVEGVIWDKDGTQVPQASVTTPSKCLTWDDHGGDVFDPADATHIATFDPPTVLALLARLEVAEEHVRGRKSEVADLERERDALAAEVERLKLVHVGQARLAMLTVYLADVDGDEATQAFYREWVRNHDAALIESLAHEAREALGTESSGHTSTYSVRRWLRERARQVREGEA